MYGWQYTLVSGLSVVGSGLAKSKREAAESIVADIKKHFPKEPKAYLYLVQEAPDQALYNVRGGSVAANENAVAYEGMAVIDKLEPEDYMHMGHTTSPIAEANPKLPEFKAPPFSLSQYALIKVTTQGRIPGMLYFADPEAPLRALATWMSLTAIPTGRVMLHRNRPSEAMIEDEAGLFFWARPVNTYTQKGTPDIDLHVSNAPFTEKKYEATTWNRWTSSFWAQNNGRGASPAVTAYMRHGAQQEQVLRRGAQQHDKAQMDRLRKELFQAMSKFRPPTKNNPSFEKVWDEAMRRRKMVSNENGELYVPAQGDPDGERTLVDPRSGQYASFLYGGYGWSVSNVDIPTRAKNNFSLPWSKAKDPALPTLPKLGYREAVDIAVALADQVKLTANLPRNGQLHFLVKAPSADGGTLPVWYFLDRVSLRDMGEASTWGSPTRLIQEENPWAKVRLNLAVYGKPEDQYLVVLDTYMKEASPAIGYAEARAKSNPQGKTALKSAPCATHPPMPGFCVQCFTPYTLHTGKEACPSCWDINFGVERGWSWDHCPKCKNIVAVAPKV